MVKKLISVDEELWRAVRIEAAARGVTIAAVVREGLKLVTGTARAEAPLMRGPATRSELLAALGSEKPALLTPEQMYRANRDEASADTRCVCGVRWKDHQAGGSGKLAVATNCRQFREG